MIQETQKPQRYISESRLQYQKEKYHTNCYTSETGQPDMHTPQNIPKRPWTKQSSIQDFVIRNQIPQKRLSSHTSVENLAMRATITPFRSSFLTS